MLQAGELRKLLGKFEKKEYQFKNLKKNNVTLRQTLANIAKNTFSVEVFESCDSVGLQTDECRSFSLIEK